MILDLLRTLLLIATSRDKIPMSVGIFRPDRLKSLGVYFNELFLIAARVKPRNALTSALDIDWARVMVCPHCELQAIDRQRRRPIPCSYRPA